MSSPLAEKVQRQISRSDTPDPLMDAVNAQLAGVTLSDFERDLRDWGLVVGLAFGIARADDPFESPGSVAGRALQAARLAYAEWGRAIARAPTHQQDMRRIHEAYVQFRELVSAPGSEGAELDQALARLDSAILATCPTLSIP